MACYEKNKDVYSKSYGFVSFEWMCESGFKDLENEFAEIKKGPSGAPYKSVTSFSDSLRCMDNLMLSKNIQRYSCNG